MKTLFYTGESTPASILLDDIFIHGPVFTLKPCCLTWYAVKYHGAEMLKISQTEFRILGFVPTY